MTFRKIRAALVHGDIEQHIGEIGNLFFDIDTGVLRLSDGTTPGGNTVSGGGGGDYTLPTASTTVKGGVKVDGSTITINNQVISGFSGSYTDLTNKPTIPSLDGYATETYVTTRGYLTSVGTISYNDLSNKPTLFSGSYTDLTDKPNIPSLNGYATETFVTTRGYLTSVGTISYNDLTDKPNLAGTYTFNVAADDSTLRTISSEETVKFIGANGITTGSDAEGNITITASSSLINGNLSVTLNTDGSMTFPNNRIDGGANTISVWSSNQSSIVWRGTGGEGLPLQSVVQSREGLVNIGTTTGTTGSNTNYSWQFNTSGQMTFPDATVQSTAWTGTAAAGTLTGTTLNSTVVTSSLTSVGTLNGLTVNKSSTGTALSITATNAGAYGGSATWQFVGNGNIGGVGSWIEFPNGSVQTTAYTGNAATVTNGVYTTDTGTVTNTMLAGSIDNNKLANSSITVNGTSISLGSSGTVTAAADTLTGTELKSTVVTSSLTSVGTLTSLTTSGAASITYTPGTATGSAITAIGKDTQGGIGYFDFLKATNTTSGVTNANKTFRLNSTGTIEVINSAYTATIFSLTDAGALSVPGPISVAGKKAVNGPAFRAYVDGAQTINSGSQQTVTFGSETFDTDGCFASNTFTPNIEGYYQFNATVRIDGTSTTGECMIILYKNSSEYARGTNEQGTEQGNNFYSMQVSDIAYANGTTDSFHIRIQQTSGSNRNTTAGSTISYFSGSMIRGA